MNLAILMANTDESAFSERFPKDGDKFQTLIKRVRPAWTFEVFSVKNGEFPKDCHSHDGFLITGSPASVHDEAGWIDELCRLIVKISATKKPLFGACFGHQVIAKALGGVVAKNPDGWVLGAVDSQPTTKLGWQDNLPDSVCHYAAHMEQVVSLPEGAQIVRKSKGCPVAGFVMGEAIYTTQYHPEMTPDFIAALTEELTGKIDSQATDRSRKSLQHSADNVEFAESIARFYEHAAGEK